MLFCTRAPSLPGGDAMGEYGPSAFALTTAQRGLWFSERISPGAILNIAEAVEIRGQIRPEVFQRALRQVLVEAEQLRVRILEYNGHPVQVVQPLQHTEFPYLDLSGDPNPVRAIEGWMQNEVAQP